MQVSVFGCSATIFEFEECSSSLDCQSAFGFGSMCNGDGFCETAAVHPRCTTTAPADLTFPQPRDDVFMIATLFDHSVEAQVARYRSVELALSQVNELGGLGGKSFVVLHCTNEENHGADSLAKDEATVELAHWLAEGVGVPAIIGPAASSRTEAAFKAIEGSGVLLISPSATSPTLTDLDGTMNSDANPGLLWRTAPPDSLQGAAIADDMLSRDIRDVEVVYQSGAYGDGLATVFADAMEVANANAELHPFDSETARGEVLTDVAQRNPAEVLFISSDIADIVTFVNTAASLTGYAASELFLTDTARTAQLINETGSARSVYERIRGTAPSLPSGAVFDAFAAGYLGRYGDDVSQFSYAAHAFDAGWLIVYGHAHAWHQQGGRITGENLARGLRALSSGDQFKIRASEWNAIEARLREGSTIDIEGASGSLDFDPNTEETAASIDIWSIDLMTRDFVSVDLWP